MLDNSDFHPGEVAAQEKWQTTHLWDKARRTRLRMNHIPEPFHERIEHAPFFFLATSDKDGSCDCSFKGGMNPEQFLQRWTEGNINQQPKTLTA